MHRLDAFVGDTLGIGGVFLQPRCELFVNRLGNEAFHFAIAEFRLGLAFKLRFGNLYRYHRGQAFAKVVAGRSDTVFDYLGSASVLVYRAGKSTLKARQVRSAFDRVDVIGEAHQRFGIAIGVLHDDVQYQPGLLIFLVEHYRPAKRGLALVKMLHKSLETLVVLEGVFLVGPLIFEPDADAFV